MKISIVINVDSRKQNDNAEHMFSGVSNFELLTETVVNKIKFFSGFDIEVIVIVDVHENIPSETMAQLQGMCDVVLFRKHTAETNFNDWNYLRGLRLATGDIICHFDADTAAFTSSPQVIQALIDRLEHFHFISYPSPYSPVPAHDESFDHLWVSTRFFMCKKESLDLNEIEKCFDYDYWCKTYPVNRVCPWMEHWIGSIAKYRNQSIIYPPIELDLYTIFCWKNYKTGTLKSLNDSTYEQVKEFIYQHGGIHYPCDLTI